MPDGYYKSKRTLSVWNRYSPFKTLHLRVQNSPSTKYWVKVARAGTALLTMTPRAVLPFQDRNFQTPKLSRGYKCWTQEHKNVDCRMHACIVKKLIGSIENLFYCFERLASVTSDRTALCGWNCDVQFPIRKTLSEWLRDPKKLLGCGFHG